MMKYLTIVSLTAVPLIGMPAFSGTTYKDYVAWRVAGITEGVIVEPEWRILAKAEVQIMSFVSDSLEIQDEDAAKEVFTRLIRNRSLEEIELIAAVGELTKRLRFKSEFELIAVQNERLLAEASTEERKDHFKNLLQMSRVDLKEAEEALLNARENLMKTKMSLTNH